MTAVSAGSGLDDRLDDGLDDGLDDRRGSGGRSGGRSRRGVQRLVGVGVGGRGPPGAGVAGVVGRRVTGATGAPQLLQKRPAATRGTPQCAQASGRPSMAVHPIRTAPGGPVGPGRWPFRPAADGRSDCQVGDLDLDPAGAASSASSIADSTRSPPRIIRTVRLSPPNTTAKNAAKTGSMVMMIAARVGGRWACAQVWPIIAPAPATTAM